MFVVQLIGALIVLILEAFNKTDFRQQLIYFYYRYGTSLHNPINPYMPIEHSRTLIYSLKNLFNQPKTLDTQYLDYLLDDTILYWYRIDCQMKVHLDSNFVYILTYNNILSVFQIQNQDLFDVEFYGFNKEIKLKLIYETKIQGEFHKSQLIGQELHLIMQEDQKYIHYLYIDNNLLQFKLLAEEKTIQFYSHNNYLLIISQTHNINYVASIRNQTDIQQLFRLFHKGQYMMNIPIMCGRNRDLVDFISIIIDDYSTKISFIHYQVSVNSGYGSSSTIFQEDASKLLDSQFRNKLTEFIKYTTYQDRIYLIIGQQHYFIKPYILGHDRYEVIKLKSSLESKNKVIDMKMNNQDLLILTYNFYSDTNQFYYLNLTQIHDNQELYLKLEDVKSYLNKLAILDFMILSQQNLSEILLIYESGDILVGQLQHPLYYQLFSWTSGLQGNVQKIGFPVFVTAIMELIRQGRQN